MKCLLCGAGIDDRLTFQQLLRWQPIVQREICQDCWQQFEWITGPVCEGCGQPQVTKSVCSDCTRWNHDLGFTLQNHGLLRYNDAMHNFMKRYKFVGDYRLRNVFASEIVNAIRECHAEIVVPIPINPATWQDRGFNQVTGMISAINYQEVLATRQREKIVRQSHKNRQERLATEQPFCLVDSVRAKQYIKSKRVLLVDDIYTTGRTLYHAAELLYQLDPLSISSLTLAR